MYLLRYAVNSAPAPVLGIRGMRQPTGTQVNVGEIGTQRGFYNCGTQQIVVPKPRTINGVQVINSSPLK